MSYSPLYEGGDLESVTHQFMRAETWVFGGASICSPAFIRFRQDFADVAEHVTFVKEYMITLSELDTPTSDSHLLKEKIIISHCMIKQFKLLFG